MADVLATLRLWSATEASNLPTGGTTIGSGLDDNLRAIQAVVRKYMASAATPMASATTVDLSTADGYYVSITGTTTITGLGTESAGISYLLVFAGVLTLTHNGTSLILPGSASITTAAGDAALMISLGSGNWKCAFYQSVAANSTITSLTNVASINGGPIGGLHNIVINGGFTVNQRGYASAAVLASGAFGHDRWKGGSTGGTYSFTQLKSDTTITIAASKTLIQVVEDVNVQATAYVLSWTGTCTARYAINSATPVGNYAASPILITGQTVGTTMSIEFGPVTAGGTSFTGASGTVGKIQLERGTTALQATSFEQRFFSKELLLCQRYYEKSFNYATAPAQNAGTTGAVRRPAIVAGALTTQFGNIPFLVSKCPGGSITVTTYNPSAANAEARDLVAGADCSTTATAPYETSFVLSTVGNVLTVVGSSLQVHWAASSEL